MLSSTMPAKVPAYSNFSRLAGKDMATESAMNVNKKNNNCPDMPKSVKECTEESPNMPLRVKKWSTIPKCWRQSKI